MPVEIDHCSVTIKLLVLPSAAQVGGILIAHVTSLKAIISHC